MWATTLVASVIVVFRFTVQSSIAFLTWPDSSAAFTTVTKFLVATLERYIDRLFL